MRMVARRSGAVRLEIVTKEDVFSLKMCENGVLVEYMGMYVIGLCVTKCMCCMWYVYMCVNECMCVIYVLCV